MKRQPSSGAPWMGAGPAGYQATPTHRSPRPLSGGQTARRATPTRPQATPTRQQATPPEHPSGAGPGGRRWRRPGRAMGKEQELLEAARTGNLPAVEKLLSGKRLSSGFGSGGSGGGGGGGSGGGGGGGSGGGGGGGGGGVGHPLSSLLR